MLLRLFKSNVVKLFSHRCLSARPFACRISPLRPMGNSCGFSFSKQLDSKLSGGGMRHSLFDGISHVSSVRPYHELLVKNLPLDVTEKSLHQHFSQCGMLLSVKIVRAAKTGESKEHGFVVFADKEALDKALNSQPHLIGNRPVTIRPIQEIRFKVTELSPSSTVESLRAYFSRFGKVLGCNLKRDPIKRISCGFVDIWDNNEVDLELVSKMHVIDGKQVKLARLVPRELTLHVGNLSPTTTDQSLNSFYSQFGNLLRAEVMHDRQTGHSRCFGYVCFASQQQLDNAVRSLPHIIDGEEVKISYNTHEFTLFAANLPPNVTEDSLRKYFERFGPVYHCNTARDKQTNQLLCHGWVVFSSLQGLNAALASRPLFFDGKQIDAKSANKNIVAASTLFVGGLTPRTTDLMLYEEFSKFGSVVGSDVKLNQMNGQSKGYGFVAYASPNDVQKALRGGPHVVDGRVLTVQLSGVRDNASSGYVSKKNY